MRVARNSLSIAAVALIACAASAAFAQAGGGGGAGGAASSGAAGTNGTNSNGSSMAPGSNGMAPGKSQAMPSNGAPATNGQAGGPLAVAEAVGGHGIRLGEGRDGCQPTAAKFLQLMHSPGDQGPTMTPAAASRQIAAGFTL
jgi:hypothetical protein